MIQEELQLNFGTCIFDHFIIPKNNDWAHEMKRERLEKMKYDKELQDDIKWVSNLIDKYSV